MGHFGIYVVITQQVKMTNGYFSLNLAVLIKAPVTDLPVK